MAEIVPPRRLIIAIETEDNDETEQIASFFTNI
jgi:hypothetical protein